MVRVVHCCAADGRPLPVALDPCAGIGVGTRLHFLGTRHVDAPGNQRGDLERAAYEFVDKALGDRGEPAGQNKQTGIPLHVLQTQDSRITWCVSTSRRRTDASHGEDADL